MTIDPRRRPRRLRTTPAMRRLTAETRLNPAGLVLPMFVQEGITQPVELDSLPGVKRHTLDSLARAAAEAAEVGLGGVMLFGVPATDKKDSSGSQAVAEDGILNRALATVRAEVGDDLVVMADTCLDEFTTHGHCGVLAPDGSVDNDATLEIYGAQAVAQARAGAHMVGPSGMMDHQVAAIRDALDAAGLDNISILAYAAKYASAFYGPFREAVACSLDGDRRSYQMDPANRREGRLETSLDIAEGADMVMVKPAGYFLDVLADIAASSPVPVAAYQVSGEYAMIQAAARNGWIDGPAALRESVLSIHRAGANVVLTYAAMELAQECCDCCDCCDCS
ncbi:MAG: porphobilinogen synthase [Propionibacteriaceae bacterium]|nr:porphobilinogen synthase [Propionibacteriaceae bacterium]